MLAVWLFVSDSVLTAMMLVMVINKEIAIDLRYDRTLVESGEWWRLITGHLQHLSWEHLILNAIGLIFVWMLVGDSHTPIQWIIVTFSLAFISSMVFLFNYPELKWYVGMSGVLHGLLVSGLVAVLIRLKELFPFLILIGVAAKIGWEHFNGSSDYIVEVIGGQVVTEAHMIGAAIGLFTGLLIGLTCNKR